MKPITNKNIIEVISESFKTIKFKKPKELKGVKPFISYRYCKDVTCQAFIKNDDLWIKHCGWYMFYKAWIKINGILKYPNKTSIIRKITHDSLIDENSRFNSDDCRMFIDVCLKAWIKINITEECWNGKRL